MRQPEIRIRVPAGYAVTVKGDEVVIAPAPTPAPSDPGAGPFANFLARTGIRSADFLAQKHHPETPPHGAEAPPAPGADDAPSAGAAHGRLSCMTDEEWAESYLNWDNRHKRYVNPSWLEGYETACRGGQSGRLASRPDPRKQKESRDIPDSNTPQPLGLLSRLAKRLGFRRGPRT